jgi:hypothetical protein
MISEVSDCVLATVRITGLAGVELGELIVDLSIFWRTAFAAAAG